MLLSSMHSFVPRIGMWGVLRMFPNQRIHSNPREMREKPLELSFGLAVIMEFISGLRIIVSLTST